jgi:hypothetical protein
LLIEEISEGGGVEKSPGSSVDPLIKAFPLLLCVFPKTKKYIYRI